MKPLDSNSSLDDVIAFIAEKQPFTAERYPALRVKGMPRRDKDRFAISHSILHMNKSIGELAREVEHADHGLGMDYAVLRIATMKMVANSLRLAEALGMNQTDVAIHMPLVMK